MSEIRRRASTECNQYRVRRSAARYRLTRDHVLRTDEERPLLIRRIRKQPRDAAVDHNVGIALAKAEIMDADVTRTLPMNGGRNTVNFSKVGDHQGRETIQYRIRFTDFKFDEIYTDLAWLTVTIIHRFLNRRERFPLRKHLIF